MPEITEEPKRPFWKCSCGRVQTQYWEEVDKSGELTWGGCTEGALEVVGWRKIGGVWKCPFCTGNTKNLFEIFENS